MVLFFTTVLVVSSLGMLAILWLKRYELRTSRVFLAGARPRLGDFFAHGLFWVEGVVPVLFVAAARRAWGAGRIAARAAVARGIILVERGLERGLSYLRQATTHAPARKGEASAFLREVAEHKKKLQEDRDN